MPCAAGVDDVGGDGAVGLLSGEQRRCPGRCQCGDEAFGPGVAVRRVPPDQPAEHDLSGLDEPGGVLQVGGGDSADRPVEQVLATPDEGEFESLCLEEVSDVHVLTPCTAAGSAFRLLIFTR